MVVVVVDGRLLVVLDGQCDQSLREKEAEQLVMGVSVAGLDMQDNVWKTVVHCK